MHFKQFYLGCLAHASYLVGDGGEAAVVDPQRDVDQYLEEAARHGLRIRWVIETHLHADFVSGHHELAERTGAEVVFGRQAQAAVPHRAVADGEELGVGALRLRILETPGHTPESISVLVVDPRVSAEPQMVLTGDTLFVGDVGRPDLAGGAGYSTEQMASLLYDSLHQKILPLPDAVKVYPAHGAGSLCGRNISKETFSTLGEQRRANPALQPMDREAFVRMVTADLPEQPSYFARDAALNRTGAAPLAARPPLAALSAEALVERVRAGARVLDVRPVEAFGDGHVPGSINVGLGGQFAAWAGALLPFDAEIVLVADDPAPAAEAAIRLARVGLERVTGYLDGGVEGWAAAGRPVGRVAQRTVHELAAAGDLQVVDVRRPGEYASGHAPGALSFPLDRLERDLGALDPGRPTAVICAGGYRSIAGASILARNGFADVSNVMGGTAAWAAAGLPLEKPV